MSFVISHPDIEGEATIAERALPAYAAKGWLLDGRVDGGAVPSAAVHLEQPNRSDSAAKWKTYAVALGVDNGGLSFDDAMAATRDELADRYDPKPDPTPTPTPKAGTPAKTPQES